MNLIFKTRLLRKYKNKVCVGGNHANLLSLVSSAITFIAQFDAEEVYRLLYNLQIS